MPHTPLLPVDGAASSFRLFPTLSPRPFEAQGQGFEAPRRHQLSASLRPRLSLFAQGFYGCPGYNMFDDMSGPRADLLPRPVGVGGDRCCRIRRLGRWVLP